MNTTTEEAIELASAMVGGLEAIEGIEKVVCPPFVSLIAVADVLSGSTVALGAQNMYHETEGAFTGEVSPAMLASICRFVILGHSERRQIFGETDGRQPEGAGRWEVWAQADHLRGRAVERTGGGQGRAGRRRPGEGLPVGRGRKRGLGRGLRAGLGHRNRHGGRPRRSPEA